MTTTSHKVSGDDWRVCLGEFSMVGWTVCVAALVWQVIVCAEPLFDQQVLARLKQQHGAEARQRGELLNRLIKELSSVSDREKLTEVNRYFNQFIYVEDEDQWSVPDYWATPEEFVGTHRGDCEDYVIAKYFSLRALGVDEEKLYLTYVKAVELNVAHMVLTYFETPNSVPLVLDNYDPRIVPANQRGDLLPVYSFNARSFFLTSQVGAPGRRIPTEQVKNSKWRELLDSLRGGGDP